MPQLNLNPWFAILVFTWIIFLTVIPTKVLGHLSFNEPIPMSEEKHKTESWNWPW
uniref:ATP synthase complex subunit 8 n=1 Tax=Chrosomus eos TaxID=42663 RepID=F2EM51_9TELE|nr:ATP synthase F0 subunit 8 [Chrosomus eos]BAK14204.1 ATPase subunit 8 [Chrosomus eos]